MKTLDTVYHSVQSLSITSQPVPIPDKSTNQTTKQPSAPQAVQCQTCVCITYIRYMKLPFFLPNLSSHPRPISERITSKAG